jgi:hypothetical protein
MSIPNDLAQKLDTIAREFTRFAKNPSSGAYKAVLKVALERAHDSDCDRAFDEPYIRTSDIYDLHDGKWTQALRRSDNAFDRLCQEYTDAIEADPRAWVDSEEQLEIALDKHFWAKIGDEVHVLNDEIIDEVFAAKRTNCEDELHLERNMRYHYASRTLTASDRSALIRLASTMPVGSTDRRAILAGLSKSALTAGTVRAFIAVALSKLTQFDQRLEAKQPNPYRLGHYFAALDKVRGDVADVMDDAGPEALGRLRASFDHRFTDLPPINATIKQIDQFLATGKLPSLVRR